MNSTGPLVLRSVAELRAWSKEARKRSESVAFVPTMGALHEGHLALVRRGHELAPRVIASIFVNPTQFGPQEDFARYPRDPEADTSALAGAGCDAIFLPAVETIYPPDHATFVDPAGAALGLEGDLRPGHFRGVATVVTQLFGLVQPDFAIFGEKDAQQLAVIRQLVRDLHLPVEIVAHPTVRESDGLAMSSRNRYLSATERASATALCRGLSAGREAIVRGERRAASVLGVVAQVLDAEPALEREYVAAVDASSFRPLSILRGSIVLAVAARLGSTRLIDNFPLAVD